MDLYVGETSLGHLLGNNVRRLLPAWICTLKRLPWAAAWVSSARLRNGLEASSHGLGLVANRQKAKYNIKPKTDLGHFLCFSFAPRLML